MKQFDEISGSASKNISDLMLNFTDPTEEVFTCWKRAQRSTQLKEYSL